METTRGIPDQEDRRDGGAVTAIAVVSVATNLAMTIATKRLHQRLIDGLSDRVVSHSNIAGKPLEVNCKSPLPSLLRIYAYNATSPSGGRPEDEYKIQVIVPGQKRGERASFDHSNSRIVLLLGYAADLEVCVLWDAGAYDELAYSRNVQVKARVLHEALTGSLAVQTRRLASGVLEKVVAGHRDRLPELILKRTALSLDRLTSES